MNVRIINEYARIEIYWCSKVLAVQLTVIDKKLYKIQFLFKYYLNTKFILSKNIYFI